MRGWLEENFIRENLFWAEFGKTAKYLSLENFRLYGTTLWSLSPAVKLSWIQEDMSMFLACRTETYWQQASQSTYTLVWVPVRQGYCNYWKFVLKHSASCSSILLTKAQKSRPFCKSGALEPRRWLMIPLESPSKGSIPRELKLDCWRLHVVHPDKTTFAILAHSVCVNYEHEIAGDGRQLGKSTLSARVWLKVPDILSENPSNHNNNVMEVNNLLIITPVMVMGTGRWGTKSYNCAFS